MDESAFRILLLNPPHTAIGSRIPREQLPPLGLLSLGGPLLDAGFQVELLDAEFGPLAVAEIVRRVLEKAPDVLMVGHSGSTSAHPTVASIARSLKRERPQLRIVYGGVFPTYHWQDVLEREPAIDCIVRGEGERTAVRLARALARGEDLAGVPGLAYRLGDGRIVETGQAEMILDLDECRVGWELIDHDRYSYWGGLKAVVVQFSRGCPYLCSYCGQRGFWTRWRHRDPVRFARELARLHREHGVRLINFADELPTGSRKAWKAFLEALIAENVDLTLVGSTRAGDIVRDADILHLYKRAGVVRFLLGIESYSAATLSKIRKGASVNEDREAIRLLRKHGIISMATYVVGFDEEGDRDYWNSLRHLLSYDPDQIQLLYVTPHRWTPYYDSVAERRVIQTDARKWDYKHQVLATSGLPPWRVLLWVKAIEAIVQLRPRALYRSLLHPDRAVLAGMRWYVRMGRRVWLREVFEFFFAGGRTRRGPTVEEFWGRSLSQHENALAKPQRKRIEIRTFAS
ncbi:magnesium-protoporphyrin IX monomethyl ester anaerobic oxidative cyclase [Lysobacter enzymogenes]|uniref:magnesium-protoporphyrin IX monomethyl ester anaerobic oxidative cyclase n=1 Tax=Lysobacter enzymogenes TaxID=69 RepID=UPI0019D0E92E|nr:magnesium-protoporphyrin IX monomethyl ester anaerobic oxidative cyclase [Lysobacter enzymogenes]MBN7138668.1 magnesium-protoporphyrin IX monomethyl ester anaerobic oxidative cyclase [Lysobacter enzymogenes]